MQLEIKIFASSFEEAAALFSTLSNNKKINYEAPVIAIPTPTIEKTPEEPIKVIQESKDPAVEVPNSPVNDTSKAVDKVTDLNLTEFRAEVVKALNESRASGSNVSSKPILEKFGAKSLHDIRPEDYSKFIDEIKNWGVTHA